MVAGESGEVGNPGTLGMTKERVSSGNWFEGSQVSKARPGAPFDFNLRCCIGYKLCRFSPDSLSASRLLGMKKERATFLWKVVSETPRLSTTLYETVALSFVIPSEAEGSAVPRTSPGNTEFTIKQNCHLDRSVA